MPQFEPSWSIILTRQAETTLRRLPTASFRLLDRQISALAENPRPLECQRLVGYGDLYRLRVSEWRIAYAIEDERRLIFILEIVPKQQPERYQLEFEETELKGEGGAPEAETIDFVDLAGKIETLRHLIPDLSQPEVVADLVKNLELLKRLASAQLEASNQAQSGHTIWYLLYCTSRSERDLKQRLLRRIQQLGLAGKVLQVVVPGETEAESSEVEEKQAASSSFYGIVLVEMVPDEETWEIVRTTSGVSAYLGSDDRPTPPLGHPLRRSHPAWAPSNYPLRPFHNQLLFPRHARPPPAPSRTRPPLSLGI
jgi:mRNA-degrading endonuclease RelE of RelBE toxin-antitoxin system